MKIDNAQLQKVLGIYKKQETGTVKKMGKSKTQDYSDSVQLSDKAKAYAKAVEAFDKLPDIRKEKVERIKAQIDSGSYNIRGEQIIDKIIKGTKMDEKI
ncbi:MAG: flagellar biosynthesis anti-sigma factor FlgM [Clostridia bacterium]|nr:flagellar biosynthesis anti-sigma factor FlgM [Clostridia bacterium]